MLGFARREDVLLIGGELVAIFEWRGVAVFLAASFRFADGVEDRVLEVIAGLAQPPPPFALVTRFRVTVLLRRFIVALLRMPPPVVFWLALTVQLVSVAVPPPPLLKPLPALPLIVQPVSVAVDDAVF